MKLSNLSSKILIVDDEPVNIKVLANFLQGEYITQAITNGLEALEYCFSNKPDLVLLDIMMPDMDGYEVCKRLQAEEKTRDIPIIFITALNSDKDQLEGFNAGAVDYITKPFNPEIVRARVRTQLELKWHREHLDMINKQLDQQIIHTDRLATLGNLFSGFTSGIMELLKKTFFKTKSLKEILSKSCPLDEKNENNQKCISFREIMEETIAGIDENIRQIKNIIQYNRMYSLDEENIKSISYINKCVENALKFSSDFLKEHVIVKNHLSKQIQPVYGNSIRLEQVFINLFKNASDATKLKPQGILEITDSVESSNIVIKVEDNGSGIPEDKMSFIWQPFFTVRGGNGSGIGLAMCKRIIEDHKGTIKAQNIEKGGVVFIITLPIIQQ